MIQIRSLMHLVKVQMEMKKIENNLKFNLKLRFWEKRKNPDLSVNMTTQTMDDKGSELMNIYYVPGTNLSRSTKKIFLSSTFANSNNVSTNSEWELSSTLKSKDLDIELKMSSLV